MTARKKTVRSDRDDVRKSRSLSPDMHPELAEFVAYWQSKRRPDGSYPRFEDIKPIEISALMPGVVIIKQAIKPYDTGGGTDGGTDGGTPDFSYVYVGAKHYEANGLELTGRFVSDVYSSDVVEEAFLVWRDVLRTGEIHYWGRPNPLPDREITSYERVLMPMADAEGRTTMLIGYWIWQ